MLETEIKKLTDAITRLADLMEQSDKLIQQDKSHKEDDLARKAMQRKRDEATPAPKADEPAPKEEKAPSDEPSDFTHDSLKSMALAIAKKDRPKSKDIKAKLADHDAKVMTDLSGDALRTVGEWLTDLKQEVGA